MAINLLTRQSTTQGLWPCSDPQPLRGFGPVTFHVRAMKFKTPRTGIEFEISDEWWSFSEMDKFKLNGARFYLYTRSVENAEAVDISEIEPPTRNKNIPPFKKYKLVPVLMAFTSPECELPPVEVVENNSNEYRFKVKNGYHRYYASVAVGYPMFPILITEQYEL